MLKWLHQQRAKYSKSSSDLCIASYITLLFVDNKSMLCIISFPVAPLWNQGHQLSGIRRESPGQGSRLTMSRCHRRHFAGRDALILLPATLWHLPRCHNLKLANNDTVYVLHVFWHFDIWVLGPHNFLMDSINLHFEVQWTMWKNLKQEPCSRPRHSFTLSPT